jgi:hypothetical protein
MLKAIRSSEMSVLTRATRRNVPEADSLHVTYYCVSGFQGRRLKCCSVSFSDFHPECFPIALPEDDPVHGKSGERCEEYARSGTAPRIGCTLGSTSPQVRLCVWVQVCKAVSLGTAVATPARFEVFTAATMKNDVFWDVTPCGSCKNRVSEELSASFIRVTRIGELGTTLAVTSNRRTWYFFAPCFGC